MSTLIRILKFNLLLFCLFMFLLGCNGKEEARVDSAVPVETTDPGELIQSAVKKQEIGAYEEAIEILNKALEWDPRFVPAQIRVGWVYEEWDKREEAIEAYEKTLELDPANTDARLGLGSVYSKSAWNDLAVEQYLKVAETRPDDPEIHFKIALEYWYLQDISKAAEYYQKVTAIDPTHLQAHLNLISVYERMKDWEKAIEEIEIARKLGHETENQQAISIAENKLIFIKGRMNLTKQEMKRKTEPPFD
ncbi:hypothetical protein UR09_03780 [Candidatus Nitromaritima sp. SCGC AAA799-A02]|nr:hypothetical protein UR09_03780 [Candidatus Nitromaritima sp. SCGC AAA799-A02]KMP12190.1 hypothetical protein UZ36_01885 [Candidatus Nitromaritima sp. SCGC AAA799-C22]